MLNRKTFIVHKSIIFGGFFFALLIIDSVVSLGMALSAWPADREAAKVAKFTFGTPTSVTRTGFVKVTVNDVFTPEKGYGFQSTQGLMTFDRGGSEIVLPKDEYTASVYGAYRTTSDITCAFVEGTRENAFVAALPDGEYTVWLIACDAECDPPLFEVWANGEKKLDVRIPRRAFVLMESFQALATDGHLRIELKGPHGWILNGLIIGKEGPGLAEVIKKVERDIFFLTEQEVPNWHEVKSEPVNPPLDLSASEKQKGYVVFPVDYTELITPTFVPMRNAIGKPLTAFATPGEFEPTTFCVSSHKELGRVTIELSDFVSDKTKRTIAKENVKVGIVRCWPQRVSGWGGKGEYYIVQTADKDVNVVLNWSEGDYLQQGERLGQIRWGSQTDLVIPLTRPNIKFEFLVKQFDHVEAGIDGVVKILK